MNADIVFFFVRRSQCLGSRSFNLFPPSQLFLLLPLSTQHPHSGLLFEELIFSS